MSMSTISQKYISRYELTFSCFNYRLMIHHFLYRSWYHQFRSWYHRFRSWYHQFRSWYHHLGSIRFLLCQRSLSRCIYRRNVDNFPRPIRRMSGRYTLVDHSYHSSGFCRHKFLIVGGNINN